MSSTSLNGRAAAYRRLDLDTVRVVLIAKRFELEATIHVEKHPDARFSDVWESFRRMHDARRFLPLTDVTIERAGGRRSVGFMAIDREEVVGVYPLEEAG